MELETQTQDRKQEGGTAFSCLIILMVKPAVSVFQHFSMC